MQQSDANADKASDAVAVNSSPLSQRRGNVEKCPVCGSHVDAEAFHCPTCHNEFCFHCRARMCADELKLQCINQECEYYGKLVCDLCDQAGEKDEEPAVYFEPEDGYWPVWLLAVLIVSVFVWFYASFLAAAATALLGFVVGGLLLQLIGLNVFGKKHQVQHERKSLFHTCISCQQPVKEMRGV